MLGARAFSDLRLIDVSTDFGTLLNKEMYKG